MNDALPDPAEISQRFAPPQAAVLDAAAPVERRDLPAAEVALLRARLCIVLYFVSFVAALVLGPGWMTTMAFSMLATYVVGHVYLGIAAARAGRSWLLYGALPLVAPILGFLVSFGVLRSRIPYARG